MIESIIIETILETLVDDNAEPIVEPIANSDDNTILPVTSDEHSIMELFYCDYESCCSSCSSCSDCDSL